MIKEDYVSFETAKLLKEKGFEENCAQNGYYTINKYSTGTQWNPMLYNVGDITFEYSKDNVIYRPTLQMAMKWLREVHNTQIEIPIVGVETWENPSKWFYGFRCQNKDIIDRHTADFECYEEALDAAIKYCLENLI